MISKCTAVSTCCLAVLVIMCQVTKVYASVPYNQQVIGVADFSGQDKLLGKFIADTLLTDLNLGQRLDLVEREQIGRAVTELRLQSSGLTRPTDIKRVGSLIGADYLIVGSYLDNHGELIINARVVSVHSGRLVAGEAANAEGSDTQVLQLTRTVAARLYHNICGRSLEQDSAGTQPDVTSAAQYPTSDVASVQPVSVGPSDQNGGQFMPGGTANSQVTEADLQRLSTTLSGGRASTFHGSHPNAVVNRLRTMVVIVRALLPFAARSTGPNTAKLPVREWASIPFWARPYIEVAIARGFWPASRPLLLNEPATREFVKFLVDRFTAMSASPVAVAPPVNTPPPPVPCSYTGLIVDARGLGTDRCMGLRILDEDGNMIYPTPNHMPDPGYIDQNGDARFVHRIADAYHAGPRPLVVRAIDGRDDILVVNNRTARRIRRLNADGQFLWHWNVTVVLDYGH